MQDSASSAGFTAVNGDTNGKATTSFRPSTSDEAAPATSAHAEDSATATSGEQTIDDASSKRDSEPVKALSTTDRGDRSPPAKRKRTSVSPSGDSRRPTPSPENDANRKQSDSQEAVVESRIDSKQSDSPPLSKRRIDPSSEKQPDLQTESRESTPPPPLSRSWKPQDVRPETREQMKMSLQSHLETSGQQSAERSRGSISDRSPTSPESGAASSHPVASTEASAAPQDSTERRKPKREFSRRTKSGCHTCRHRKKKCGEERPECKNCNKGNFVCAGYGPKPQNYRPVTKGSVGAAKTRQPSYPTGYHHETQAGYPQYNGAPSHHAPPGPPPHPEAHWPQHPHQPYPHDGRPPPPPNSHPHPPPPPHIAPPNSHGYDQYHQRPRDPWQAPPPQPDPNINLQFNSLPRVDYSGIPPLYPHATDSRSHLPPPPPPQTDPWHPSFRSVPGPGTAHSSHESVATSAQHRLGNNTLAPMASIAIPIPTRSERAKMIQGDPVQPYLAQELVNDASDCTAAVEEYNSIVKSRGQHGQDHLAQFVERILDPSRRHNRLAIPDNGPVLRGTCGLRTIIKTPFYCEFGYNLNIGKDVIIRPNCSFSDPCEIRIGNGCVIGEGVRFAGWSSNISPQNPSGSQGEYRGGAIIVGDNVKIGAGAIILAYRRIGDGAVIGAGSVVTKNVAPRTVVCGNPARVVRELPESGVTETRQRNLIQQENDQMIAEMGNRQRDRERTW